VKTHGFAEVVDFIIERKSAVDDDPKAFHTADCWYCTAGGAHASKTV